MSRILLQNVSKVYGDKLIFKNVNLDSKKGQIIAIKGPSGVGKSSLLNIIAGLEHSSSGTYNLDGLEMESKNKNDLTKIRSEKIGYISQFNPMVPKLTAYENICIPLLFSKKDKDEKHYKEKIRKMCEHFGVSNIIHEKISKLSGGEIQRIGIIRSMINNPSLLVADEPTGSLDDENAASVLKYFNSVKLEGLTIILATHSKLVANYCDKVYQLTSNGLVFEDINM